MNNEGTQSSIPRSRFWNTLPASHKAIPKEMLALVDKPIIQYGVEEALAAGSSRSSSSQARGKSAIEDHFDVSYELEVDA